MKKFNLEMFDDFQMVEPIWRELEARAAGPLYQTFEWLSLWHEHRGRSLKTQPFILVGFSNHQPVFLLPMMIIQNRALRMARWMGDCDGNQNCGLWDENFLRSQSSQDALPPEFSDLLIRHFKKQRIDFLKLRNTPQRLGQTPHPLLSHLPAQMSSVSPSPSSVYTFSLKEDFDALNKQRRSASSRKKLRAKTNRLKALGSGTLEFSKANDNDAADKYLNALLEQRSIRAQTTGVPTAFESSQMQNFLKGGLHRALSSSSENLMIHALLLDGEPIATYLGGVFHDQYYAYANSIVSNELSLYSPGDILLSELIKALCHSNVKGFDFGLGEERYKTAWASPEPLQDIRIILTTRGRILSFISQLKGRLKYRIRSSKRIWPLVRQLRKLKAQLKRKI